MKTTVKNSVDRRWAREAMDLLASCSPDVHTLYTRLLTSATAYIQEQKTERGKLKYNVAYKALIDRVKYGWQFGILERPAPPVRFSVEQIPDRRVRALLRAAQEAGHRIALAQLGVIRKRHATHLASDNRKHGKESQNGQARGTVDAI